MGSKERKARNRLSMHKAILYAALSIVREEGHQSLSLRRLASDIEFSPTALYLYFKNKEALLVGLTRFGYQQLNMSIDKNCKSINDSRSRLKAILTTYWNFANHEKELYLLMQQTETRQNESEQQYPEMQAFINSIKHATAQVCGKEDCSDGFLKRKCYISIAIVQGLASLNLNHKGIDACSQSQMLDDAIDGLIGSLH